MIIRRTIWIVVFLSMFTTLFWMGDTLTKVRLPTPESPIELYSNQMRDDIKRTLLRAIQRAENSIVLFIYSLSDPKIIHHLRKKADDGISVTVIYDPKASYGLAQKLGPNVQHFKRNQKGLMHRKILVIDGIETWIGSSNLTPDSLRVHGNLVMGINDSQLASVMIMKTNNLNQNGYSGHKIGGHNIEMIFLPEYSDGVERIKSLINSANKTVRVAMFTFTQIDIARALVNAKERGVDTEVVIDYNSGKGASLKVVEMLKKNGVKVSLSSSTGLLHHKFLYIDGNTLVNGSANWTKAAFTQNDDCYMILHSLNKEQTHFLNNLWKIIKQESI